MMIIFVGILFLFPELALWLPRQMTPAVEKTALFEKSAFNQFSGIIRRLRSLARRLVLPLTKGLPEMPPFNGHPLYSLRKA